MVKHNAKPKNFILKKKTNNTAKPSLFFTIYSCNKLLVVFTRPRAFFTLSSHHCMPP